MNCLEKRELKWHGVYEVFVVVAVVVVMVIMIVVVVVIRYSSGLNTWDILQLRDIIL